LFLFLVFFNFVTERPEGEIVTFYKLTLFDDQNFDSKTLVKKILKNNQ